MLKLSLNKEVDIEIVDNMARVLTTTLKMMENRKITIKHISNSRRKHCREIFNKN